MLTGDLSFALRLLRRQPRHAVLVTLTMALGIGAVTTFMSLSYAVLLRPLPWPNADRLVVLKETRGGRPPRFGAFSNGAYYAWQDHPSTIAGIAAWAQRTATLSGPMEPERVRLGSVSPSLFGVLGVQPLVGSFFTDADQRALVVVLSESLWRRRFSADPSAVGRLVRLDGQAYRIVGVLADAFAYPDRQTQAWVPQAIAPPSGDSLSMFNAVAALRPGATALQAAAEGTARGKAAPEAAMTAMAIFGGSGPIDVSAVPLRESLTAAVRRPLLVLLAAALLLLLLATANVAGLQLLRGTARTREFAIRAAIGANASRLIRQVTIENLLLGLTGGMAGIAVAWALHRLLPSVLPADFPRIDDVRLDATVVIAALAVSMCTALVCGWLPALQTRARDLMRPLAEDGRAPAGLTGRSRAAHARSAMLIGQIAITCVLLVGAALIGRTFITLLTIDRGYEPSHVVVAPLSLPAPLFSPERRYEVVTRILDRLQGQASVGFTSELPLTPGGSTAAFDMRSPSSGRIVLARASPRVISAGAFAAMGMRLRAGRGFTESDTESSKPVAVVNRSFSQTYLDGQALGAKVPMGVGYQNPDLDATVVGVVDDVRYVTGREAPQPEIYYSYRQLERRLPVPVVTLLVRTDGDPRAVVPLLRSSIREADESLAPGAVMTLQDRIWTSLASPRVYAVVLAAFAVGSLIVSSVGLFGVLAYSVALRARELAVRSALGARGVDIAALVLRQGLAITAAGIAAGLIAAAALAPLLSPLLSGVSAYDLRTYGAVVVGMAGIATLACAGPALRAARTDPLRELRS